MKRKLFSAILFGALLATSTSGLTSCKDYDDDITNLQGQIDKLATKDELSTKANELANSISAAQQSATAAKDAADKALAAANGASSAADAAAKAAKNAQDAADKVAGDLKTAVENAAQQIQDAVKDLATKQQVTDAVKEVKDKYDAQAKELKALSDRLAKVEAKLGMGEGGEDIDLTEIQAELEDIEDAFEALVGVVSDMVTSVELVYNSKHNVYRNENDLDFNVITEKKNETFGKDVADKVLTTAAGHTVFASDTVLIRVNPVDAEISAEDISLINSKGEELTGFVEATKVERYSNNYYMTRAAGANTGLWKVYFAPVDGKKTDDLKEKFVVNQRNGYVAQNYIVYGVAVKSAISDSISADRRVVSAYDVTMKTTGYTTTISDVSGHSTDARVPSKVNDIKITTSTNNAVSVNTLYNRSDPANGTELIWKANTPQTTNDWNYNTSTGTKTQKGDDRSTKTAKIVARVGEDIKIKFDEDIKGFYVTLDRDFAESASAPSEINAWDSYTYENVAKHGVKATMFEGNEGTIKVSELSHNVTGDEIGFRIYAMNLDGTLVDPDGVAFYVVVGETGDDVALTAQSVEVKKDLSTVASAASDGNITSALALPTDYLKVDVNNPITSVVWSASKGSDNYVPVNNTDFVVYYGTAANAVNGSTWNNAKFVAVQLKNPKKFVDGETYTFTGEVKKTQNGTPYTVKKITVQVTKVMPKSCPTFIWKTNQTELQALVPVGGYAVTSTPKNGILNFNNMFVVADGSQINADQSYVFKLAGSEINTASSNATVDLYRAWGSQYYYNGTTKTTNSSATASNYEAYIANKFIDGTTAHALTTEYNYGEITSKKDANDNYIDYKLSSSNYNLTYTTWSIQSADYMTYAWKKVNIGTGSAPNNQPMNFINTAAAPNPTIKIANILATNGQMINGDLRQPDLNTYVETKGYLVVDKVETKSNTNYSITNEYYTPSYAGGVITFTLRNTGNTVPDHTAKVQITVKDCFGHKEVIELTAEFKAISGANAQLASN